MRIKGSDLRKIIKEEIIRAARLNESTYTLRSDLYEADEEVDFSDKPQEVKPRTPEEKAAHLATVKKVAAHMLSVGLIDKEKHDEMIKAAEELM